MSTCETNFSLNKSFWIITDINFIKLSRISDPRTPSWQGAEHWNNPSKCRTRNLFLAATSKTTWLEVNQSRDLLPSWCHRRSKNSLLQGNFWYPILAENIILCFFLNYFYWIFIIHSFIDILMPRNPHPAINYRWQHKFWRDRTLWGRMWVTLDWFHLINSDHLKSLSVLQTLTPNECVPWL